MTWSAITDGMAARNYRHGTYEYVGVYSSSIGSVVNVIEDRYVQRVILLHVHQT